jgi:VanZ family protein
MAESLAPKRSSAVRRFIRYWLPVILLVSVMFSFSGDTFSDYHTRGRINRLLLWLFPDIKESLLVWINYFVRKAAHLFSYAVLTAMLFRAFRADSLTRWRFAWAVYSIVITIIWALLDEYRQSFVPSRSGSIYDSMIDTVGGVFALAVIYWFTHRSEQRDARQQLK